MRPLPERATRFRHPSLRFRQSRSGSGAAPARAAEPHGVRGVGDEAWTLTTYRHSRGVNLGGDLAFDEEGSLRREVGPRSPDHGHTAREIVAGVPNWYTEAKTVEV